MNNNNPLDLVIEFNDRLKKISSKPGYGFVFDSIKLIRDYLPCREISITIIKAFNENPNDIVIGSQPIWVSTPLMGRTKARFFEQYNRLPYYKSVALSMKPRLLDGMLIEPYCFSDHFQFNKRPVGDFYINDVKVSDVMLIAGEMARHQFYTSPATRGLYLIYCVLARDSGQMFGQDEKKLLALFFDLFRTELLNKIRCTDQCQFLPFLTGKIIRSSKWTSQIFDYGNLFKLRELKVLKVCFDLHLAGQEVNRNNVAHHLYSGNENRSLSKHDFDRVDYDFKKIKSKLLEDFDHDSIDVYHKLRKEIRWEHMVELFKTYAYFGLLPSLTSQDFGGSLQGTYISCFSEQLKEM